ncbi:g8977 [Coccomyxa viridis]|uniref:G8977 protein n=1 Tax=Coccomyxa viridis TaxID=1274662 RepID=A0ABP1G1U3_9CHLO
MLIRLRSRDGLERILVPEGATIASLKRQITESLEVPQKDITLSTDKDLLTALDKTTFTDMTRDQQPLSAIGIQHGDMVYMHYPFEREVPSTLPKGELDLNRPFGMHMTVEALVAKQTRIERQETPHCSSVSFDRHAANAFQSYVSGALAFSIKRGGLLYGSIDEEGKALVEVIYEPEQEGTADSLQLIRGTDEEQKADFIAKQMGLSKIGWIFTQSTKERDFIMSSEEICQIAEMQAQLGEKAVTGVVSMAVSDDGSETHFEAFQVSDQAVRLWQEGWFQSSAEPSGVSILRDPKEPKKERPVIVAGKDQGEVDNDYLLLPVNILDHEGPLSSAFPIENRLLPQEKAELRHHLQKQAGKPYQMRLADFHLLLWLAKQPNLDLTDLEVIIDAVKEQSPVPEGYTLIIDSLAEL